MSGPPLVLLHGGSARWQSSMPLIPALSQRWHLYAPDLRGHDKSGWVPGHYRLNDYYEQLFQMISCPVLIIQGSPALGGLLTNEEIERAPTFLPQARVARMETVGHPLHTQEKEPVLLALTSFLETWQEQR